jgi:hypothetical protein
MSTDADARRQVRRAVTEMTGGAGDPRSAVHDPLAALRALTSLRGEAVRAEREAARRAREDGLPWSRVGEAMGFADRPRPGLTSVAERAFLAVASDLGSGPSFAWTCPSCGGVIVDYGPETGHPADAEHGHAEGCKRLAETVRAWDASWEDSSDE